MVPVYDSWSLPCLLYYVSELTTAAQQLADHCLVYRLTGTQEHTPDTLLAYGRESRVHTGLPAAKKMFIKCNTHAVVSLQEQRRSKKDLADQKYTSFLTQTGLTAWKQHKTAV